MNVDNILEKHAQEMADQVVLTDYISESSINKIRNAGFNKVATALVNLEKVGQPIAEIDFATTAQMIGERAFTKRAQQRMINQGIAAYRKLQS